VKRESEKERKRISDSQNEKVMSRVSLLARGGKRSMVLDHDA
jgi:hypothetical protein